MNQNKKISGTILYIIIFTIVMMFPRVASAASWVEDKTVEMTEGAFAFEGCLSKDATECWIKNVRIDESKREGEELTFPAKISGAIVTKIGAKVEEEDDFKNIFGGRVEPWHDLDGYSVNMKGIQRVIMPDSVKELSGATLSGMRDLEKITLSREIKELQRYTFYHCKNMQEITLPQKLKKFDNEIFMECENLKKVSISKENKKFVVTKNLLLSKDKKKLIWAVPAQTFIRIPNTVRTIRRAALGDSRAKKLHIGKNVSQIETNALRNATIDQITVDRKNKTYAKKGSCIYKKKGGKLVAGIVRKQKLTINKKIKSIPDEISLCGYGKGVYEVDIASSVKKMSSNWISLCYTGHNPIDSERKPRICFRSVKPPKLVITDDAIASFPYKFQIYVPKKSIKQYKKWVKKYKGRNTVKAIK